MRISLKSMAVASIIGAVAIVSIPAEAGPNEDILFRQLQIRTMGYSAVMLNVISQGKSDQGQHFET